MARQIILGYAAGFVYWFGLCNWIQWTLEHHAGVSSAVAWMLFTLFCLAKAVQMGVFGALSGPLMTRRYGPPAWRRSGWRSNGPIRGPVSNGSIG